MTMTLYHSPASPYVRKVLVTAIETGQGDQIRIEAADNNDLSGPLQKMNPLGKIPVLVLEDGRQLFDSPVICEYLDSLHDRAPLFPGSGEPRFDALVLQALGDGMMDAALSIIVESRRPEEFQYGPWFERQRQKIAQGLDYLENRADSLSEGGLTIGKIAVACFLGHAEYREVITDWRGDHPKVSAWYEEFRQRPSMQQTAPPPA